MLLVLNREAASEEGELVVPRTCPCSSKLKTGYNNGGKNLIKKSKYIDGEALRMDRKLTTWQNE